MEFKFFTNEKEEVINLVNDLFNKDYKNDFNLLNNQKLLLLKDSNILVGLCLITEKYDPFRKSKTYYLDYLCIKKEYQNNGLGTKMFNKILEIAKENNIDYIELTSNKDRINARKMYLNMGMKIKDTDIFIKEITNGSI